MSARDRLLSFIEQMRLPKRQFYQQAGLSSGFLTKNRNIGSNKLESISRAFPELSLEWIVTGEGTMLKSPEELHGLAKKRLPLLEIAAALKEPVDDYGQESSNLRPIDEFYFGKSYENCTMAMQIWGDDMRPEFCPGDIALFRKLESDDYIQWGFAHLVIAGENCFFKRLQRSPDENKLRLLGTASNAEFLEIEKKHVRCIYEARGVLRKLMS